MPRRSRQPPFKESAPEQSTPLSRIARLASDWRAIVSFVLLASGGIAYAVGVKFATKDELATVKTDVQSYRAEHNAELTGIHQAIGDFSENQKQMMDWVRDIYQHPRK